MKFKFLLLLSFLITTIGCSEKEITQNSPTQEIENYEGVIVTIEGVFEENDNVAIYYDREDNFTNKRVEQLVLGSSDIQFLEFKLPEEVTPEQIKISLSKNPAQKRVSVRDISVKYRDNVVDGSNGKFVNLFTLKNQVKYDRVLLQYTIVPDNESYSPWIAGGDDFKSQLADLFFEGKASTEK